jgi:hypothetical protein
MARVLKPNTKVLVLLGVAFFSLVIFLFNVTKLWGIHDLSNELVDAKSHVDMETQLRLAIAV